MTSNILNYFFSYVQYKSSRFLAGRKNYNAWKTQQYTLHTVKIQNYSLAKDLEAACQKNAGFLTYAEYLDIEQFGENGYHATSSSYGMTDTWKQWPDALVTLCEKYNYAYITEIGPGAGELAIATILQAKKKGITLIWNGIEKNIRLQEKIKHQFLKAKLQNNLGQIAASLKDLKLQKSSLIVFSYSLDSIPPEVFLNTTPDQTFPNALLGIHVANGILSEVILTKDMLKKRQIILSKGIYTYKTGCSFDLTSWKLYQGQRAYIPLLAFQTFVEAASFFPQASTYILLDEFRKAPPPWEIHHLSVPHNLSSNKRVCNDTAYYYKTAGTHLFYYPFYLSTFYAFLHSVGFQSIQYDIEQKLAKELSGKKWLQIKDTYHTYAFLAREKINKPPATIRLLYPHTSFF